MSALGDYIHLSTKNYLKYGVSERDENPAFKYKNINDYMKKRTQNLRTVSEETLETLRYRIAGDSETIRNRSKDNQEIQRQWQKNIDWVYQTLASFTSNELMDNLRYSSFKDDKDILSFQPSLNNNYKNQTMASKSYMISEFQQKIKSINDTINKINEKHFVHKEQIESINNKYQDLEDLIKRYQLRVQLPELPIISNLNKHNNYQAVSLYAEFQKVLNLMHFVNFKTNLYGDFGEYLLYTASDQIYGTAKESADKMIEQAVVGEERSGGFIPIETFARDLSVPKIFSKDVDGDKYVINTTQNKVDVQITVNGEDVYASAKAYRDLTGDGAKLQSPMSLLPTIAYLNSINNFGNHWLNMHAAKASLSKIQNQVDNADLVLKQELAYEALVIGNPWKQGVKEADTFVAIERGTGRVAAFNSKDILLNNFDFFTFSPTIERIRIRNNKSTTATDRITNMLVDLHSKQITVHFKVGALKRWT